MTVGCPKCGTRYRVPAGTRRAPEGGYRCARCRTVFGRAEPATTNGDEDVGAGDDDERFVLGDDEEIELPREPAVDADEAREEESPMTSAARFALHAVLAVTLGYAVLSIYLYTHPAAARTILGTVPLIGKRLAETRMDPASIQLTNVRGEYQRVQSDQLVFVVSGVAINNSPVAVRGIQIEGRAAGTRELRQVVFCGTATRSVADLSVREIALLQTLEPPKDWSLGAGEQASFAVVFIQPPTDLREFSAEVVAVQLRRRRGGAPAASATASRG